MYIKVARLYGILIAGLALIGLVVSGHLFDLLNVDTLLNLTRIVLAIGLLYYGYVKNSKGGSATWLVVTGVAYLLIAVGGMIDATIGGLLPSGLTEFDIAFHLITGLLALGLVLFNKTRYTHNEKR
jgi:hypothetical protein